MTKKDLYKKCKCEDKYWEELIASEDNEYNDGNRSIFYHCTKCGIDWAVEDEKYGFLLAKYIKSRKITEIVSKKYSVEYVAYTKYLPIVITAPDKEIAKKRFWYKINKQSIDPEELESYGVNEITQSKVKQVKKRKKK